MNISKALHSVPHQPKSIALLHPKYPMLAPQQNLL